MSNDLRLLQIEELNMLHVFVDICEKNSLRYFIIGGTLLGAVRNKGSDGKQGKDRDQRKNLRACMGCERKLCKRQYPDRHHEEAAG